MNHRSTTRAFTLIELLVVISIIALLIGILLPVLGNVRSAGRSAACLSNLRQTGIACYLYVTDEKGYWPIEQLDPPGSPNDLFSPASGAWHIKLVRYLPEDRRDAVNGYLLSEDAEDSIFRCPEWEGVPGTDSLRYPSYGISNYTMVHFDGVSVIPTPAGPLPDSLITLRFDEVIRPSEHTFTIDFDNFHPNQFTVHFNTQQQYADPANWDCFRYDHNDAANWLFYDGHAASESQPGVEDLGQWVWAPRRPRID